jgi:hypothetical protein
MHFPKHEAVRAVLCIAIALAVLFGLSAVAGFYGSRHRAALAMPDVAHAVEVGRDIYHDAPPIPGVEGFELRYQGLPAGIYPFLERGWITRANFPYFTYDGDTYERAGVGGVVIRHHETRPTRYLVTETVQAVDPREKDPQWSMLSITDKKENRLVAYRTLRQGEMENGQGWVGQHAIDFVRKILVPTPPTDAGDAAGKPYPYVSVDIEPQTLGVAPALNHDSGCGSSVTVSHDPSWRTLDTAQWSFRPRGPIVDFACSGGRVLILSRDYGRMRIDILTLDGACIFQSEFENEVFPDDTLVRLDKVSLEGPGTGFDVVSSKSVYIAAENKWDWRASHRFHVSVRAVNGVANK